MHLFGLTAETHDVQSSTVFFSLVFWFMLLTGTPSPKKSPAYMTEPARSRKSGRKIKPAWVLRQEGETPLVPGHIARTGCFDLSPAAAAQAEAVSSPSRAIGGTSTTIDRKTKRDSRRVSPPTTKGKRAPRRGSPMATSLSTTTRVKGEGLKESPKPKNGAPARSTSPDGVCVIEEKSTPAIAMRQTTRTRKAPERLNVTFFKTQRWPAHMRRRRSTSQAERKSDTESESETKTEVKLDDKNSEGDPKEESHRKSSRKRQYRRRQSTTTPTSSPSNSPSPSHASSTQSGGKDRGGGRKRKAPSRSRKPSAPAAKKRKVAPKNSRRRAPASKGRKGGAQRKRKRSEVSVSDSDGEGESGSENVKENANIIKEEKVDVPRAKKRRVSRAGKAQKSKKPGGRGKNTVAARKRAAVVKLEPEGKKETTEVPKKVPAAKRVRKRPKKAAVKAENKVEEPPVPKFASPFVPEKETDWLISFELKQEDCEFLLAVAMGEKELLTAATRTRGGRSAVGGDGEQRGGGQKRKRTLTDEKVWRRSYGDGILVSSLTRRPIDEAKAGDAKATGKTPVKIEPAGSGGTELLSAETMPSGKSKGSPAVVASAVKPECLVSELKEGAPSEASQPSTKKRKLSSPEVLTERENEQDPSSSDKMAASAESPSKLEVPKLSELERSANAQLESSTHYEHGLSSATSSSSSSTRASPTTTTTSEEHTSSSSSVLAPPTTTTSDTATPTDLIAVADIAKMSKRSALEQSLATVAMTEVAPSASPSPSAASVTSTSSSGASASSTTPTEAAPASSVEVSSTSPSPSSSSHGQSASSSSSSSSSHPAQPISMSTPRVIPIPVFSPPSATSSDGTDSVSTATAQSESSEKVDEDVPMQATVNGSARCGPVAAVSVTPGRSFAKVSAANNSNSNSMPQDRCVYVVSDYL